MSDAGPQPAADGAAPSERSVQPAGQDTGAPAGSLTCYRCGEPLLPDPEWCPACGASQITMCRGCGTSYRKADGRCPTCGLRRVRRRRRPRRLKALKEGAADFLRLHRRYVIYVMIGLAVGALSRGVVIHLASYSMPPDWLTTRNSEPFTLKHFLDPFIGTGLTLGRWTIHGLQWPFLFAYRMMRAHPSALTLGIIGSALGMLAAYVAERRRKRG